MNNKSIAAIFLFGLIVPYAAARAADPATCELCNQCGSYLKFAQQYTLAGDLGPIAAEAARLQAEGLASDADRNAAMRLMVAHDDRIPKTCRQWVSDHLPKVPAISLIVREGSPGTRADLNATYFGQNAMSVFNQLRDSYAGGSPSAANYKEMTDWLAGLTPDQLQRRLTADGYAATLSDAKMVKAYSEMTKITTKADLKKWAAGTKNSLSIEEFLGVLSMFGDNANAQYDDDRAAHKGPHATGPVSVDQVLTALHQNIVNGSFIYGTNTDHMGVCRDDAPVVAAAAEGRGLQAYIVGYRSNDSGHVTAIIQDPAHPTHIYGINWMELTKRFDTDGSVALYQGNVGGIIDSAARYQIFNAEGKAIDVVSSEAGKVMAQFAGFGVTMLDPLARETGNLVATQVSTPNGTFQAQVGMAQDANGSTYVGGGGTVRWNQGGRFPGRVGFSIAVQNRPASVSGDPDNEDGRVLFGSLQLEQHAQTRPIKIGETTHLTLDAHLFAQGAAFIALTGRDSLGDHFESAIPANNLPLLRSLAWHPINSDSSQGLGAELRLDSASKDGKWAVNARVGTQVTADADINFEKVVIVPIGTYVGATGTVRLKDVKLFADTLAVVDNLGARGRLEAGAAGGRFVASAFVSGRLTDHTAMIQDQALRRAGINVTVAATKNLHLGLTGEMPIEGDDPLGHATIFGTGEIVF